MFWSQKLDCICLGANVDILVNISLYMKYCPFWPKLKILHPRKVRIAFQKLTHLSLLLFLKGPTWGLVEGHAKESLEDPVLLAAGQPAQEGVLLVGVVRLEVARPEEVPGLHRPLPDSGAENSLPGLAATKHECFFKVSGPVI